MKINYDDYKILSRYYLLSNLSPLKISIMVKNFFGAKASVYLKFDGKMEDLAELLSDKMEIPQILLETDQDPPHELFGMSEVLGFELWLFNSNSIEDYKFKVEIETSMSVENRFAYEQYDLSPWFAEEISRRCDIETHIQ